MKKLLIFTLAIFIVLLACENNTLQEDLLLNPIENGALQGENSFEPLSNYDGTAFLPDFEYNFINQNDERTVFQLNLELSGTTRYEPVLEPCGGYTDVIWEGSGTVKPFGDTTFYAHYYSIDGTNPSLPVTGKLISPKRDELHIMLYYSTQGTIYNHYQDWIIYDGTGKFKNATGELKLIQTYIKGTTNWNIVGKGIVAYCH